LEGHPAFDLDWNLVRTFVAVARAGSLAAGARSLGITHPTAARHIQLLEDALGMTLFSRTGQGLVLNDAGKCLDDSAQVMHKSALAFQAASDTMREQPVDRVRISVAEILAELLPDVMMFELRNCSETSLSIDMVVTDDLVNLLERDADIALRHVRPEQQELICKKVGTLDMGIYAHRDYVAEHGMLQENNLSQHRFVDGMTRDYLSRGAAQRGLELNEDQIVLRSDSLPCQRAAVSSGWGVGAFPVWMANTEADWVSVFAQNQAIDIEVWLVGRPEVRDSEQLRGIFTRLGNGLAEKLA
jgi:DNA-binding transcriptional LysR family regulator